MAESHIVFECIMFELFSCSRCWWWAWWGFVPISCLRSCFHIQAIFLGIWSGLISLEAEKEKLAKVVCLADDFWHSIGSGLTNEGNATYRLFFKEILLSLSLSLSLVFRQHLLDCILNAVLKRPFVILKSLFWQIGSVSNHGLSQVRTNQVNRHRLSLYLIKFPHKLSIPNQSGFFISTFH